MRPSVAQLVNARYRGFFNTQSAFSKSALSYGSPIQGTPRRLAAASQLLVHRTKSSSQWLAFAGSDRNPPDALEARCRSLRVLKVGPFGPSQSTSRRRRPTTVRGREPRHIGNGGDPASSRSATMFSYRSLPSLRPPEETTWTRFESTLRGNSDRSSLPIVVSAQSTHTRQRRHREL